MTLKCRENPRRKALSRLGSISAPLALALGIVTAFALASCGGGNDAQLLPGGTANEITANLETVDRLASEGECVGAEDAAERVSAQVEELHGVDETLVRALRRGSDRLNEVVAACEETSTEELAPATTPEPSGRVAKDEEKAREKEEKELEKEEEKAEKEEEKEAKEEGAETGPPAEVPPPHSNGQGEEPDGGGPSEGSSGGISPSDAVGGED